MCFPKSRDRFESTTSRSIASVTALNSLCKEMHYLFGHSHYAASSAKLGCVSLIWPLPLFPIIVSKWTAVKSTMGVKCDVPNCDMCTAMYEGLLMTPMPGLCLTCRQHSDLSV